MEICSEFYYLILRWRQIHIWMWGQSPDTPDILYAPYMQTEQQLYTFSWDMDAGNCQLDTAYM